MYLLVEGRDLGIFCRELILSIRTAFLDFVICGLELQLSVLRLVFKVLASLHLLLKVCDPFPLLFVPLQLHFALFLEMTDLTESNRRKINSFQSCILQYTW